VIISFMNYRHEHDLLTKIFSEGYYENCITSFLFKAPPAFTIHAVTVTVPLVVAWQFTP